MTIQLSPATGFAGELIGPDHPGYDEARRVYNGAIDRRPALIARCTGPQDVRAALAIARERELAVAVRGGGHSISGFSTCDDGIVIDVGPIDHARVDPAARRGRFGAGLTWGAFDAATQAHGLAVTGGRVTHTGVAGLTLGSGSGWLERALGPTCQSLLSAEVVTADGRILRASATEHPELFWGLKGGGGNFGVVTELEFRLHPIGPLLHAGIVVHPRSAARGLLRHYRDVLAQAPDAVGGGLSLRAVPHVDPFPPALRGRPAALLTVVHAGDPAEGERALAPLVGWGDPWLRLVQPMPYVAVQRFVDGAHPWGICHHAKLDYLPGLPDEAIDTLVRQAGLAGPRSGISLLPLGGAMARVDRGSMALEVPRASFFYMCEALWTDPADADAERTWARDVQAALQPWSTGTAVPNFIAGDDRAVRLRVSYGEEKFARLQALKDTYDPENVFALNQNVPPSG
jgi:FAD/FMN-containing dehydrogenase